MERPNTVPAEVTVSEERILVLGVPLGTDAFIARRFAALQHKTQRLLDALPSLEDPQIANLILRYCAHPRFHYYLRTTSLAKVTPTVHQHDRAIMRAACTLFRLGTLLVDEVTQLSLPLDEGGFGFTPTSIIIRAAYFGMRAVVLVDVYERYSGAPWMPPGGRAGLLGLPRVQEMEAA